MPGLASSSRSQRSDRRAGGTAVPLVSDHQRAAPRSGYRFQLRPAANANIPPATIEIVSATDPSSDSAPFARAIAAMIARAYQRGRRSTV
jgi:hypothetical protein